MTQFAPPAYPPAQYPQAPQPQQQWPVQPAAPAYPPQQFQQPQYGPPPMPGYPPVQMAQPAQPLAQGSIDDFYNQPTTGGGKALTFNQLGDRYIGIVTRALSSGDIQQQTNTQGVPQFFKDGRPKFVMKVPLQLQPSPAFPDGLATWFVKGAARDELVRAMAEAGAPAGPPEHMSIIDVTFTSTRQSGPGMNPAKLFHVVYTRPSGETSSPAPAQQPQAAVQAPVAPQQPQYAPPAVPQQAYAPPAALQQSAPAAPAPAQAAAPGAPQPPADLLPEQQALLAKLTGG